jgi:predicted flap endonuclease-1-like 5' DNA nuclease
VEAVPDDLTRIEGIGPYYRDALHKLGITSFAQLAAQTDAEALVTLLKSNGYRQHPSIPTWAEQAALAAAGDWEALTALQATLSGGRRSGD